MKTNLSKLLTFGAVALLSITLFSCQKDPVSEDNSENASMDSNLAQTLKAGNIELPGRALASNCFQCHGTNGYAGELKIAGIGASELAGKFSSMKSKSPGDNIMNVHAQAYTPEEVKLIGDFFSKQ
jgi:sulfide dehydrogenase cytochrome subunit